MYKCNITMKSNFIDFISFFIFKINIAYIQELEYFLAPTSMNVNLSTSV